MRLATIRGYVNATIKHKTLESWRLLIAQPISVEGAEEGPPQIVLDNLGAGMQQRVMISSDGAEVREMLKTTNTPGRWFVLGIVDPEGSVAV